MRIRPVLSHATLPGILQKPDGVLHVAIQQMVVLNHGPNALVHRQRNTQRPQPETRLATALQQAQRNGRQEQALQDRLRHFHTLCNLLQICRCLMQLLEQVQAQTAQHDLGVDKTGHQVKKFLRTPPHDPARQGVLQGPLVQGRAGVQPLQALQ